MKVIHAGSDPAESAADHLARSVADELRREPRVSLALSGGESTESVWRALAAAPVDWERIDVCQVSTLDTATPVVRAALGNDAGIIGAALVSEGNSGVPT